jgi:hypothetical protein
MSISLFSSGGLRRVVFLFTLVFLTLGLFTVTAQDGGIGAPSAQETEPPIQPQPPAMTITSSEPSQIITGQEITLSVLGTNFTSATVVRLTGYGLLPTTFISPTALTAAVPGTVPPGTYTVELIDPVNTFPPSVPPFTFRVNPVPAPTAEPPTQAPPPTAAPPPTEIPGAPSLLVRSFTPNPGTIRPGDTVTFTMEIINQGSRTAQGVSLSVDPGGKFIAANGQAAVILPDLGVGASYVVSLSVVAASDTPGGPQTVGVTLTYRDFSGTGYTSKAALSVNVESVSTASQVTLARYLVDPNPVIPGESVTITVLLTNTGNETAGQVLLQVGEGILLAGPEGNSFAFGDIVAGASASLELPLIVSTTAKAGPQSQGITINYLQNGESQSMNSSMTITVANIVAPAPLLLLDSYDYGKEFLLPGEQFMLTMALKNIGDADATNMLVTFGTVESSGSPSSTPDGSGGGSTTSTTPSTTFAPLGSGGTQFAGTLGSESDPITLTQEFIVSGSVDSGIYSLPITLRYTKPDGTTAQDSLRASIVVLVLPNVLITESAPLPETVNMGEPLFISLGIANKGRKQVNFTNVTVTTDNGEVQEGADVYLGPLRVDDDTAANGLIIPSEVGTMKVTFTFNYTDDLNQDRTIVEEYEVEVVEPPPPPDLGSEPPPDFNSPSPTPEAPDPDEVFGRILFGLLGLGS